MSASAVFFGFLNFGSAVAFTAAAIWGLVAVGKLYEGGLYMACFALLLIVAGAGIAVPVESEFYYTMRQLVLRSVMLALCYVLYQAAKTNASKRGSDRRKAP